MDYWGTPLRRQEVHLLSLLQEKNPSTVEHSIGTADIAVKIAIDLGYTQKEIDEIRIGALLHDVGKVGVPNIYLNKPGVLRNYEKRLVDLHAPIGGVILDASGLYSLAKYARFHHTPGVDPLVDIVSMADYEHAATHRGLAGGRELKFVIPELEEIYAPELVNAIKHAA